MSEEVVNLDQAGELCRRTLAKLASSRPPLSRKAEITPFLVELQQEARSTMRTVDAVCRRVAKERQHAAHVAAQILAGLQGETDYE